MTSPNPTGQSGPSPLCISRRGSLIHSQTSPPRRVMAWRAPPPPLPFLAGRGPTGEGVFSSRPCPWDVPREKRGRRRRKRDFCSRPFPFFSALFCSPPLLWMGKKRRGETFQREKERKSPSFSHPPPSRFPPFATVACDLGPLRRRERRRKRRRRQNGERRKASV